MLYFRIDISLVISYSMLKYSGIPFKDDDTLEGVTFLLAEKWVFFLWVSSNHMQNTAINYFP